MGEIDSGDAERGFAQSVSRAVERENRRRKRLLALYLGLLAIPVISAVALIGLGQEERLDSVELMAGDGSQPVSYRIADLQADFRDLSDSLRVIVARDSIQSEARDELAFQLRELEARLAEVEAQNRELAATVDSLQRQLQGVD